MGPGGTGETHVVGAERNLMGAYGCEYCICYPSPTGGTAKISNGMTVHKGLGISIQKISKGKGNRYIDKNEEDYRVTVSFQNYVNYVLIGKMWMYYLLMKLAVLDNSY